LVAHTNTQQGKLFNKYY